MTLSRNHSFTETVNIDAVRHPTLYFEDGDIVLSSEAVKSQVTTFFRVDKVYLSRQSIIFQEMFTLPMEPSPSDMYDGCPWVRMPDSTDDLQMLLGAMYDVSTLPLKRRHPDTAMRLSGVMQLAKKYEIGSISNLIIRHLEADWPQNVDEWGDFQNMMIRAIEQHLNNPPQFKYASQYIDERFPEAGSTLRFALDNNCPTLLRAASMVLVTTPQQADWDKVRRSKHDMQYEPFASQRAVNFPSVRWSLLDNSDWSRIAKGKEALFGVLQQMAYTHIPVVFGSHTCRQCSTNLQMWRENAMNSMSPKEWQWPDPLCTLKRLLDSGRPDAVCGPCWDRAEKSVKDMRAKLWEELPTMFGWV